MDELITPGRHAEIKRAALRHAAGMLLVSLGEWDPQRYNPESARNDAEEELMCDEVERIADELRARSLVGTRRPCSVCGFPYVVRKDGMTGRHHGVGAAASPPASGAPAPLTDRTSDRSPGVAEPRGFVV